MRRGDHQHRRDDLERHRLAELRRDPVGPGAGTVDDDRGFVDAIVWFRRRHSRPIARHVVDAHTFDDTRAESLGLALEGEDGAVGDRRAVRPADDAADAVWRDRRHQLAQLGLLDDLLVLETECLHLRDAIALGIEFGRGLGDLDLAVGFEAAVVVDEVGDAVPDRHRHHRQRDLGDVPAEPAHATGIDTGGMAADVVLLDQQHLHAAHRQMQRRGAALDAAADDDDVGLSPGRCSGHRRTTAFRAASVCGRLASSASVIGFTGGRRRK